ncbi:MAG TPA: hypothetical protein VFZ17_02400 [Acidimicrobiia bacterium]|nr:hypothetical protein [Acidimicrobiia bacterium]
MRARPAGGFAALLALLVVGVVVATGVGVSGIDAAGAGTTSGSAAPVDRVLVISLPNVDWSDIVDTDLPNLHRLFARSAIGGLVTNGALRPTNLGASYVTLGAGARAIANPTTSGQGFDADERFGAQSAGVAFRSRTGTPPGNGLVYLPVASVTDENDAELFGAEVGLLGGELASAHVSRAVIANGDGTDPSTPPQRVPPYRRAAVAALMTPAGRVPGGEVDADLLERDTTAPFGVRLDPSAVLDTFTRSFTDRSVVLVEGSDLVRAELAANFASEAQGERLVRRALRDTDRLVGSLLDEVDPAHDAVLVVGPVPPNGEHGLTVASVQAPGFDRGLLVSSSTGHDGFVNLTDVAPTILNLLGIDRPEAMEGRRMEAQASSTTLATRMQSMVDVNTDGLFRDSQVGIAMTVVVVLVCLLAIALVVVGRWWPRGRGVVSFGALLLLAVLAATYLAGVFHFGRHGGAAAYWPFVVGVSLLLAVACFLLGRRLGHPVDGLLVALGSLVALHVADLVTGAHLEWNTVFGYSPTIGIRFVGQGNLTFAQLVSAAVLFAGLIAWRVASPWGLRIAIGVLAVTVVVMGAPFWGADFGSVVSAVPAFALMGWLLLGRRLTARSVLAVAGLGVAAVVAVGLIDVARPAEDRTHVGRFFVKLFDDADAATLVIRRKAAENLSVLGHSVLLITVFVVVALLAYLWFVRPRALRRVVAAIPTARATAVGFVTVGVLGFLLNDSGITIPGMMCAVLVGAIASLVATLAPPPGASQPDEGA